MLHNLQMFHWTRLKTIQVCSLNMLWLFYTCSLNTRGDSNISKRVQKTHLEIFKRVQGTYCTYSVFREHMYCTIVQVCSGNTRTIGQVCSENMFVTVKSFGELDYWVQNSAANLKIGQQYFIHMLKKFSSVFREHAWVVSKQVQWDICELWSSLPDEY
jgi:hypothetical protein